MPMSAFDVIAFDADDTLWDNEILYIQGQARFNELLARYHSPEWIAQKLDETEMRNLEFYGYGIKSFILSMIETSIELTEGRIQGSEIQVILDIARQMLQAEVQLFPRVEEVVALLSRAYPLMVITKGDPLDQEAKLTRSGLAHYFRYIETVSDKTRDVYTSLLSKHQIDPARFLMVGNSLRSDILPVIELGSCAVYIPYHLTWSHENNIGEGEVDARYFELEHIGLLPGLLESMDGAQKNGA